MPGVLSIISLGSGARLERRAAIIVTIIPISWVGRGWIAVRFGNEIINSLFQGGIMPYSDILTDYFGSSLFLFISTSLHKKLQKGYGLIIVEVSDTISKFGFDSIKESILQDFVMIFLWDSVRKLDR